MPTAMDDTVCVVKICQSLEHSKSDFANDVDRDGARPFVDTVKTALVHVFHAYAYMWICDKRAVKGDDILRVAIMHDLQFAQNLFPDSRFRVDQHDLGGQIDKSHIKRSRGNGSINTFLAMIV